MRCTSLLAVLALSACASSPAVSSAPPRTAVDPGYVSRTTYEEAREQTRENLLQLQDLRILRIGDLVLEQPEASGNCYGPCENDPVDQAHMREYVHQSERLDVFVEEATSLHDTVETGAESSETALKSLEALSIVEIRGAMVGNCYGPCEDDPQRHATIRALADRTRGL